MSISYAVFCMIRRAPTSTPFPYTTLFRSWAMSVGSEGSLSLRRQVIESTLLACEAQSIFGPVIASWRRLFPPCLPPVLRVDSEARHCGITRSEEHTSELQSHVNLVCRLLHDTARSHFYTLSLHDALPILGNVGRIRRFAVFAPASDRKHAPCVRGSVHLRACYCQLATPVSALFAACSSRRF